MPIFVALRALLYGLGRIGTDIAVQSVQILVGVPLMLLGIFSLGSVGAAMGLILSIGAGIVVTYITLSGYIWRGTVGNLTPPLLSGAITIGFILLLKDILPYPCKGGGVLWTLSTVSLYLLVLFLADKRRLMENFRLIKDRVLPPHKSEEL
jgi:hypothetical protein